MLQFIDSTQLCPDCCTIRTSRSRHCSVCNHCVERFDHHCPWINNCVGLRNHNSFLFYILFQTALVLTVFVQTIIALAKFMTNSLPHDSGVFTNLVIHERILRQTSFVLPFQVLLVLVTGFFVGPLIILLVVQSRNFCKGKTTMERFGRALEGHD